MRCAKDITEKLATMRQQFAARLVACAVWFALAAAGWAGPQWQFTILHTNDLHGRMMPFDYVASNTEFAKTEFVDARYARASAGGLARRATLIARARKTANHPLALVDAGDVYTRGPWHTRFLGAPEIETYNRLQYDVFCVGNNEFKATPGIDSQPILLGLMRQSRFPWLAANLTVGDTGVPVEGIHPFVVRRYGNVRVGFLGLTAPRCAGYAQTKGWTIGDPIEAAKRWVPIARKECDVLIAVTHIGAIQDQQLAAGVEGIDAIVGGDSHTFLPKPLVVTGPSGVKVPIVQAGAYGICLGRLDLTFEKDGVWRLVRFSGALIPVDSKTPEDPGVRSVLASWIGSPQRVSGKASVLTRQGGPGNSQALLRKRAGASRRGEVSGRAR